MRGVVDKDCSVTSVKVIGWFLSQNRFQRLFRHHRRQALCGRHPQPVFQVNATVF